MIDDFEKFLIDRFSDERDPRFNNLFEWRGYNLDFKWMVDDLYKMFTDKHLRWTNVPNGKYAKISDFMFNGICFLGKFGISLMLETMQEDNKVGVSNVNLNKSKLIVYSDKNGYLHDYDYEKDKDIFPQDILLSGCEIILKISSTTNNVPEYEFKSACWHELMHLYQYYSELLKNRNVLPNSIKSNNLTYGNIFNKVYEYDRSRNETMSKIARCLYKLNKDEVNAYMSMIYPFIEKNVSVNFSNIEDYIQYLEIYKTIELAKNVKELIIGVLKNVKLKDYVDNELCQIFSNKYKKEECTKLFLKFLTRKIPELQSKMYRNVNSALVDLGRHSKLLEKIQELNNLLF